MELDGRKEDMQPNSLKAMIREVLLNSSEPTFESMGSSSEPGAMYRMFNSKFGNEVANRIGNEGRAVAAISHLSSELVAESLKYNDQLSSNDRVLISSVALAPEEDEHPVVIVMTDRESNEIGRRQPNNMLPPPSLIERVFYQVAEKTAHRSASEKNLVPEFAVLEQALGSDLSIPEVMDIARPDVVFFPRPEMVNLCAPHPSFRIENGNEISTSGVLCRNRDGQLGITACYHGTGPEGTALTINGRQYEVTMADRVQDLVFIPVEGAFGTCPQRALSGLREVNDLVPARDEKFSFDGIVNPNTDTYAQSCDPWLFNSDPDAQLRMQTTRDTDQGDSGSALVDRNDKLVGFAFRMTAYGVRPGFTDWIWAPNALGALGLSPATY